MLKPVRTFSHRAAGALLLFCFAAAALGVSGTATVSAAESVPGEIHQPEAASFLPGYSWQLVEILSMDGTVMKPDDRSLYTVVFKTDGAVQIRADCNRGRGGWASSFPGKLEFTQIAATLAMCPPDSLHDPFMALFPYVRSYVVRDGRLFMATMADGSITEFEPVQLPLAAVVMGEEVRTEDAEEMRRIIAARLFDDFADKQGVTVTDMEIDMFIENMHRGMSDMVPEAETGLSAEEKAQTAAMQRQMGRSMIRQWKLNRALHERYGGRVIHQQLGPEPFDAYRQFFEERRNNGDFAIKNKDFEESFWRYFTDGSMHSFFEPGSAEEAQAFATPPWEQPDPKPAAPEQ